jgi:2-polyprenyl-3-methyl-5-hydroxy-6-metoxy-1,4-benzoquinol methylase
MSGLRGWVYDRLIVGMTADWYREVLGRLPTGARVLDVGIGTGAAMSRCAEIVREKDLTVVGLDIDSDYVQRCRRELARAGLSGRVEARLASVYDHEGGPYDAVYFSASLMLLPDPAAAITHVAAQLAPGGLLFATQTFQRRRSRIMERAKPMIRHVTTIDFGRVTYEDDFRACMAAAGVELVELHTMSATRYLAHQLAVARAPSMEHDRSAA